MKHFLFPTKSHRNVRKHLASDKQPAPTKAGNFSQTKQKYCKSCPNATKHVRQNVRFPPKMDTCALKNSENEKQPANSSDASSHCTKTKVKLSNKLNTQNHYSEHLKINRYKINPVK